MAQESNNNTRRCGQIGDGEDDELSMVDVLNEQARLQADADAVLGGSDEKNCTYPQGNLKRQALYACATCTPDGNAGICLACSYACHEGHDLYELYTKRYFACDCGNEKFGRNDCKLYKEKKELNSRNRYNQNFLGRYCVCSRPFPDPEDNVEDEMIQCIMCEDWHHGRHLNTDVPEDFEEMICPGCMSKFSFLWAYNVPSKVTVVKKEDSAEDEKVDVNAVEEDKKEKDVSETTTEEKTKSDAGTSSTQEVKENKAKDQNGGQAESETSHNGSDTALVPSSTMPNGKRERIEDTKHTTNGDSESPSAKKKMKLEDGNDTHTLSDSTKHECVLESLQQSVLDHPDTAAFWPRGWRSKLCRCDSCVDMYKDRDIEFLIDETDTVHAYEERGTNSANGVSEEESEASMLAGMGRVQQIEVVRGFMDLKTELNEFLQSFARDGKVVKESDIREFFQRMEQRRRERMELPQPNCR